MSALESLGGWPLIGTDLWNNETFDLTSLLAAARRNYGNEIFFQVYVYADAKNTTKNTLYVSVILFMHICFFNVTIGFKIVFKFF